jgi:hypothetical protein
VELLGGYSNPDIVSRLQRVLAGQGRDEPSDRTVRSPRQKQRRLNPEEISEVLQRHQAGESANSLAKVFGTHRRTIVQHLTASQVQTRYRADIDLLEARQLYEQGWSLARVGQHFGVAAGTIRRALLQDGMTTRPVGTNQWMRPSSTTTGVSG